MIKTRSSILACLTLLALVFTVHSVRAAEPTDVVDVIKRSFKVERGGTLYLDVDQGDIDVITRRGSEVVIEVELTVDVSDRSEAKRALESYRPDFTQRGSDVHFMSRYDQSSGIWGRLKDGTKLRVRVTARVPEEYNVDFTTGFGSVDVADLKGEVRGRTGAGQIMLGTISGQVDVSTGTGNVEIEGANSSLLIKTGAGNVNARNVRRTSNIHTGAGNIEVQITGQPEFPSQIATGAGNVTVYLGRGIGVDVQASTAMGSAGTDFPLTVESKFMRKAFYGEVNGGGPHLQMRAGVGSVQLKKR